MGLTFLCPHCKEQRLGVQFYPWIVNPPLTLEMLTKPADPFADGKMWHRTGGETFETLTLLPSVNVEFYGHWHGVIESGEIK
jgi:hypothetical protein